MEIQQSQSHWKLTRYFIPLAIQAASQALCYPLVAMVASRGPGGPLNLAGLAQANMVMFFIGMFAISFVTTGMVYAKTQEGYQRFWRVTIWTGFFIIVIQAIICIPDLSHLVFGKIIGLPPSIESPAQVALLASVPLQFLFFLRIPYFVVMYNGKATGIASLATIGRIIFTAVLSPLFCLTGWVGPIWAVVCLSLPVAFEVIASKLFANRFLKQLKPSSTQPPDAKEIFWFNLPLSIGGYFLSISGVILGAIMARAPDPERVLPVYYLALGLANPVAFAATRIQTVILAFPPDSYKNRLLFRFSLLAGAGLGILPLLFILPGLIELYYVQLQNLNLSELPLVRYTAMALAFYPFSVAIRAHIEGLAAWFKKPTAVLAGHAVFMGTIIVSGLISLVMGVSGYLIGSMGLTLGSLASAATMRMSLHWEKEKPIPVGQTTTSVGQIR